MKILMAPNNIAGQPILLVQELARQGIDAALVQYVSGRDRFDYDKDRTVTFTGRDRAAKQIETLRTCLDEGFDVFHFWRRTLFYSGGPTGYQDAGLDLPFIKSRDRRVVYRFTGFDVRLKSEHIRRNPYNPYRYGYTNILDEDVQKRYVAFLQEYVDEFVVGDPELHEYFPAARVVPRAVDLGNWPFVGVQPDPCPLIVHAPSDPLIKGTKFILSALEDLRAEGLQFSLKLVSGMSHAEAAFWYRKADIAIDQLCIGWHGVLALECMALGKPVVVYIREDLLDDSWPPIPIENANPDTIKQKLRVLVKDFERRRELGTQGRKYVEEVHDVTSVASQLTRLYTRVLEERPVRPSSSADVDYFLLQHELTHQVWLERLRQARRLRSGDIARAVLRNRAPKVYGFLEALHRRMPLTRRHPTAFLPGLCVLRQTRKRGIRVIGLALLRGKASMPGGCARSLNRARRSLVSRFAGRRKS